tara:strand:- start:391 stop:549 length:159 start_codon:yes stop_codon:yes gene_type:complete
LVVVELVDQVEIIQVRLELIQFFQLSPQQVVVLVLLMPLVQLVDQVEVEVVT